MIKLKPMFFFLVVFLTISFIGSVNGRGSVFIIEHMQEITESIEFTVSDMTSADVSGNVSVASGSIDFYVTSPSGIVLLYYNKTAFSRFNFAVKENGTYVMHLVNTWSTNNVTTTLYYGVNWKITLQESVDVDSSMHTQTQWLTIPAPQPFNWIEFLRIMGIIISPILGLASVGKVVLKFLKWFYWKIRYGKSRTPVVISLLIDKFLWCAMRDRRAYGDTKNCCK